jgi:hypothetical protein
MTVLLMAFLTGFPFQDKTAPETSVAAVPSANASEARLLRETPHYRFRSVGTSSNRVSIDRLTADREAAYERIISFLGDLDSQTTIDYVVYPSLETKGLSTGNTQISHINRKNNAIHVVIDRHIRGDDSSMDAALLIRRHLGKPAIDALEIGLSVYLSEGWRETGYEYWASRLFRSGNAPPLSKLLDNQRLKRESYFVTEPLAAAFVSFLIEFWGREAFLDRYAGWVPEAHELEELVQGWDSHLRILSRRCEEQIAAAREDFPNAPDFHKGFCHAHIGYRIYNGYMSSKSDEALDKLAGMGVNAVSVTPFTYMRDPKRPVWLRFSSGPGEENDESVIHAARSAQALGMSVMLKPHIWLGRHWPGDIEMTTPSDWERFFDYYYRWIRHYALLAEMYEMEVLCVGVELCRTTIGHEAEWIDMIRRLREIYSGKITYAANWGTEFENIAFWNDLDFLSINCYYPLLDRSEATVAELAAGADEVFRRIESVQRQFEKPVLITEIGFTSTPSPWENPHEVAWGKPVNLEHQAACYEAVFRSLYGKDWCRGIYWWKWPSFLEYGGELHPGFTPNNKPAEKIIRKWFQKTW